MLLLAFYWAVESMSSVGYGDVLPQTDAEVFVTMLLMVVGACLMAFMLGSVTSMVASLNLQDSVILYLTLTSSMLHNPTLCEL